MKRNGDKLNSARPGHATGDNVFPTRRTNAKHLSGEPGSLASITFSFAASWWDDFNAGRRCPRVSDSIMRRPEVDFFAGVVEGQARVARCFDAKAAEDRLGAVVAGSDGDSFLVQRRADVFGAESIQDEREHAGLFLCGADQVKAGDALHRFGGIDEQVVLVAGDVDHADAFDVIDGRARPTASAMLPVPASKRSGGGW